MPLERGGRRGREGVLLRCAAARRMRWRGRAALSAVAPATHVRARSRRLPCFGATSLCPGMGWLSGDRDRAVVWPAPGAHPAWSLILLLLCARGPVAAGVQADWLGWVAAAWLLPARFLAVSARDPARGAHAGAPARPLWPCGWQAPLHRLVRPVSAPGPPP